MSTLPTYDAEKLGGLLALLPDVDSVELKLTVPDSDLRPVVRSLQIDTIDATVRQVAFIDTPDLRLSDAGVVVRVRRTQRKPGDATVKLRPMLPADAPAGLRGQPGFKVEVDASPVGFSCSCSLTTEIGDRKARAVVNGERDIVHVLTEVQRDLLLSRLPDGTALTDLRVLGPLTLLKAKFAPAEYDGRLTAELWFLPDGTRILELSTKAAPADAFRVAAETKVFLSRHGIDLAAPQETKTRTALAVLAATLEKEQDG